ncbi:hypothetical protein GCM10010156_49070 [Planobispora rosea]|uniref:Uncharacterized protein n=1 Tax=Planobispora rosea TaxID=35762 RepID=A0A8J3WEN2_PLARO|nr:hypothetical protein GCM10010156_49070 [Planobispora rosea]GIH86418.1 hypothetical protein Pro02_48260 [Planobispora rosea]
MRRRSTLTARSAAAAARASVLLPGVTASDQAPGGSAVRARDAGAARARGKGGFLSYGEKPCRGPTLMHKRIRGLL